jgi:drug/metabolite transporter (DMT)-like permease
MTNSATNPSTGRGQLAETFLLAEYSTYQEAFAKNEELGERRLQFLLGLVTAAFGVIGLLFAADKGLVADHPRSIMWIGFALSALLLGAGVQTHDRLLKRDATSREYQYLLDEVRKKFVEAAGETPGALNLKGYDPFSKKNREQKRLSKIGRISRLTVVVNAWLAAICVVLLILALSQWPKIPFDPWAAGRKGGIAALTAIAAHWVWFAWKYRARG